jgi:TolB-like protein/DNA-binding winged helix-turn-helix (wHTH) protein
MDDFRRNFAGAPIDLAAVAPFDLGQLRVVPAERAVIVNEQRRDIQPRVMKVLVALAEDHPAVVSRDRLIERAWDGQIVGDDAINRCILALRHLAEEFTPAPFAVETVPRVGHRLVAAAQDRAAVTPEPRRKARWGAFAAVVAVLIATIGLLAWNTRSVAQRPATIAVLPFRNLSSGEPYFAQGVGEEILGILAREPGFRVTGRNAAAQFKQSPDPREVGRAFNVDYVLEGSVRTHDDRVRVNASLVQTSDGMRLWSETYDRELDDILEIQTAIGQAVASGLKLSLVHAAAARAPTIDGEAYALYLSARGLLRTQNPQAGPDALGLLQQAVRADPDFAPAWASLADAIQLDARTKGPDALIDAVPRAISAASRALALDPQLAEAHAIMAVLVGDGTTRGIAHWRRAAELAPRTSDGIIWRATGHSAQGRYGDSLADYRRAHYLDPAWPLPVRGLIDVAAMAGDRKAAEAMVREGFPDDAPTQEFGMARIAWLFGDVSEAARRWAALESGSSRWATPSRRSLLDARLVLGLTRQDPPPPGGTSLVRSRYAPLVWVKTPPSPAVWREWNRSRAAQMVHATENLLAAKLMLSSGRASEIAAIYDGPWGFNGVRAGDTPQPCHLADVPIVALALRQLGRDEDAAGLLARADARIRKVYAQRSAKPQAWFETDAAAVWAVQGKSSAALDALERAMRLGWSNLGPTDLRGIENEPAFRPLAGHPRFEAIRARIAAKLARERMETQRALAV